MCREHSTEKPTNSQLNLYTALRVTIDIENNDEEQYKTKTDYHRRSGSSHLHLLKTLRPISEDWS